MPTAAFSQQVPHPPNPEKSRWAFTSFNNLNFAFFYIFRHQVELLAFQRELPVRSGIPTSCSKLGDLAHHTVSQQNQTRCTWASLYVLIKTICLCSGDGETTCGSGSHWAFSYLPFLTQESINTCLSLHRRLQKTTSPENVILGLTITRCISTHTPLLQATAQHEQQKRNPSRSSTGRSEWRNMKCFKGTPGRSSESSSNLERKPGFSKDSVL